MLRKYSKLINELLALGSRASVQHLLHDLWSWEMPHMIGDSGSSNRDVHGTIVSLLPKAQATRPVPAAT
jgi:hypothetical protein